MAKQRENGILIETDMKIIFLDIDGVLHSYNYEQALVEKGLSQFDREGAIFDPQCISALARLIEATGAEIVIHSSWKDCEDKGKALCVMREIWSVRRLPGHVLDVTPTLSVEDMAWLYGIRSTTAWKGYEIKTWLAKYPDCAEYVIIDDQNICLPEQRKMAIKTDGRRGLTAADADKAKKILDAGKGTVQDSNRLRKFINL